MTVDPEIIGALAVAISVAGSLLMFSHYLGKRFQKWSDGLTHLADVLERFAKENESQHQGIAANMERKHNRVVGDLERADAEIGNHAERISILEERTK
jgi:hypothetical protein